MSARSTQLEIKSTGQNQPSAQPLDAQMRSSSASSSSGPATGTADNKAPVRVTLKTKDDNDCAFHAVLGVWDDKEQQVICAEAKQRRAEVKRAIEDSKAGSRIRELAAAGIKELIMAGRTIREESRKLLNAHQRFLADQNTLSPQLWQAFEVALRKSPDAMQYITEHHQHPRGALASLRDQFYDALNRNEGDLYAIIRSLTDLEAAFKQYNELDQTRYDWDAAVAVSPKIVAEYAQFVGQPGQWLLASELAILAEVFQITVEYYSAPSAKVEVFNPEQQNKVVVQFNGVNHFEQVQPAPKSKQKAPDKPSIEKPLRPQLQINVESLRKTLGRISDATVKKIVTDTLKVFEKRIQDFNENAQDPTISDKTLGEDIIDLEGLIENAKGNLEDHAADKQSKKLASEILGQLIQDSLKLSAHPPYKAVLQQTKLASNRPTDEIDLYRLRKEQQLLFEEPSPLNAAFNKALGEVRASGLLDQKPPKGVFICYAWPDITNLHEQHLSWLQPFLSNLRDHLKAAGLGSTMLDIHDNPVGGDIYHYMEAAKESSYVLLIGTESLLRKHKEGGATRTELIYIGRKIKEDRQKNLYRVIPILLSGTLETAFPAEYELYNTVQPWGEKSYFVNLRRLIASLYGVSKPAMDNAFKAIWAEFLISVKNYAPVITEGLERESAEKSLLSEKAKKRKNQESRHQNSQELLNLLASQTNATNTSIQQANAAQRLSLIDKRKRENKSDAVDSSTANPENQSFQAALKGLKDRYANYNYITRLFDHRRLPISESYINLMLFQKGREEQESKSTTVSLETDKDYVSLEQIYIQQPEKPRRVIIAGNAGTGKTTLCQRIAFQWIDPQQQLWKNYFSSVILIPLRKLRYLPKDCNTLPQLLSVLYPKLDSSNLEHAVKALCSQKPPPLWILDGYDEVQGALEDSAQWLLNELLAQEQTLITSRLHAIDSRISYDERFDLAGFRPHEVQDYINKFFDKNVERADQLWKLINLHPHLREISCIPLHLEILCGLSQDPKKPLQTDVFHSTTLLYQYMLEWLLTRHNCKEDEKASRSLDPLVEEQFENHLNLLAEIAFTAGNELTINKKLIYGILKQKYKESDRQRQLLGELLTLNILRVVDDSQSSYEFVHFSFQEFLAAKHFVNLLKQRTTSSQQPRDLFEKQLRNQQQEKFFWFTAGLLGDNFPLLKQFFSALSQSFNQQLKTKSKLFDPQQQKEIFLLMHCLEEISESQLADHYFQESLKIVAGFTNKALTISPFITSKKFETMMIKLRRMTLAHVLTCPRLSKVMQLDKFLKTIADSGNRARNSMAALALRTLYFQDDLTHLIEEISRTDSGQGLLEIFNKLNEKRTELQLTHHEQLREKLTKILQETQQTHRYDVINPILDFMIEGLVQDKRYIDPLIAYIDCEDKSHSQRTLDRLTKIKINLRGYSNPPECTYCDPANVECILLAIIQPIGAFDDREVTLAVLVDCLQNTHQEKVREQCVHALSKSKQGTPAAAKALLTYFLQLADAVSVQTTSIPGEAKDSMMSTLPKWAVNGNVAAEEIIISRLLARDKIFYPAVIHALHHNYSQNSKKLIIALEQLLMDTSVSDKLQVSLLTVLNRWAEKGNPAAEETLISCLKSGQYAIRLHTLKALTQYRQGNTALANAVEQLLVDDSVELQSVAKNILQQWSDHGNLVAQGSNILRLKSDNQAVCLQTVKNLILSDSQQTNQMVCKALVQLLIGATDEVQHAVIAVLEQWTRNDTVLKQWTRNDNEATQRALLPLLKSEDKAMRLQTVWVLGKSWEVSQEVVVALRALLEKDGPDIQQAIVTALEKWAGNGNAAAQHALLPRLQSADKIVQLRTVQVLGESWSGSQEVVVALRALLEKDGPDIQQAIVTALEKWAGNGNAAAQHALLPRLQSADKIVQLRTVQVLGESWSGSQEVVVALQVLLEKNEPNIQQAAASILEKWAGNGNAAAQQALLPRLQSADKAVQLQTVRVLGKSGRGSQKIVAALRALLGKDGSDIQQAVATILEKWASNGDVAAQHALLPRLQSADTAVRQQTVEALGKSGQGSQEVVAALQALLGRDTPKIQQAIVTALEKWVSNGDVAAQHALLSRLQSPDTAVRRQTVEALGKSGQGSQEVIAALQALLERDTWDIQQAVVTALEKWAGGNTAAQHALLPRLQSADTAVRRQTVEVLGKSWEISQEVIAALQALLEKGASDTQQAIVIILEKWAGNGYIDAQHALLPRLQSADTAARLQTIQILGKSGWGSPEVVAALQVLLGRDMPEIRQAIVNTLEKWAGNSNAAAQQVLLPRLQSADKAICLQTVQALSTNRKGNETLTKAFQELLTSEIPEVQQTAMSAFAKWAVAGDSAAAVWIKHQLRDMSVSTSEKMLWILVLEENVERGGYDYPDPSQLSVTSKVIDLLEIALSDEDPVVRTAADIALRRSKVDQWLPYKSSPFSFSLSRYGHEASEEVADDIDTLREIKYSSTSSSTIFPFGSPLPNRLINGFSSSSSNERFNTIASSFAGDVTTEASGNQSSLPHRVLIKAEDNESKKATYVPKIFKIPSSQDQDRVKNVNAPLSSVLFSPLPPTMLNSTSLADNFAAPRSSTSFSLTSSGSLNFFPTPSSSHTSSTSLAQNIQGNNSANHLVDSFQTNSSFDDSTTGRTR